VYYLNPNDTGGLGFEAEFDTSPSATSFRHYVTAGSDVIGVLASTGTLPVLSSSQKTPIALSTITVNKVEYWHTDHLGSLIATSDHLGNTTQRYSYDPFGKRRYTNGRYDATSAIVVDWNPALNSGTSRGFTRHEELDDIGLVNMNGRIYDPLIGLFTQADPKVPYPTDLQSYGPYTYARNNPLNAVDPTGFDDQQLQEALATTLSRLEYAIWHAENRDAALKLVALRDALAADLATMANTSDPDHHVMGEANPNLVNAVGIIKRYAGMISEHGDLILLITPGGQFTEARAGTQVGKLLVDAGKVKFYAAVEERAGGGSMTKAGELYAEAKGAIKSAADGAGKRLASIFGKEPEVVKREASAADATGLSFWSRSEFRGVRVYQRNDLIDPALLDARGRTNVQRMEQGLAPIGPDGKSMNLHHMTQAADSPLAELTATFHQKNSKVIHINPSSIPSGVDRKAFDEFRGAYWMNRAKDFIR
jgi:RHS repeat-associated protein